MISIISELQVTLLSNLILKEYPYNKKLSPKEYEQYTYLINLRDNLKKSTIIIKK